MHHVPRNDTCCCSKAGISRIILPVVYKLPLQSVMLGFGLGLGLKTKIFGFGLGLEAQVFGFGLGLGLSLPPKVLALALYLVAWFMQLNFM